MLLRHALGEIVRRRRQALGLTLRDVARDGRISLPYLSEVERGRKEASSEIIQAICGVLRLDLAELLLDAAVLVNQPVATNQPAAANRPAIAATRLPETRLTLSRGPHTVRPVANLTPRAVVDPNTEVGGLTDVGQFDHTGGIATVSTLDPSAFLLAA